MAKLVDKLIEAFKDWLGKRIPDCRNVTPTIGKSLDEKLGPWDTFVVKLHLFTCDRCGRYLEHLRFLSKTLGSYEESIADPVTDDGLKFSSDSKARIKDLLNRRMDATS